MANESMMGGQMRRPMMGSGGQMQMRRRQMTGDPEMDLYRDTEGEEGEAPLVIPKSQLPVPSEVGTQVSFEVIEDMGDHVRLKVVQEKGGAPPVEPEEIDEGEEDLYA